MNKFILLYRGRTGSTMLRYLLDSHPSIACSGELFANKGIPNISDKILVPNNVNLADLFYKKDLNVDSIYQNLAFSSRAEYATGFRLSYYHCVTNDTKKLWKYLIDDQSITVIHLQRHDVFRMLMSWEVAIRTNQWFIHSEEQRVKTVQPFEIKRSRCSWFFELVNEERRVANYLFRKHQVINVFYEDFYRQDHSSKLVINRIIHKLNQIPCELKVATIKQEILSPEEQVLNFLGLKKSFKGTKYEIYFSY